MQAAALAQDSILNLKTVRALEAQSEVETRYNATLEKVIDGSTGDIKYNGIWYGTGIAAMFAGFAVAFWYGAYLEKMDEADEEEVNIVAFATFMTAIGITAASLFAPNLIAGAKAAERIYAMIDYKPSIDVLSKEGVTTPITGKVEFKDVCFQYAGRDNMVLQSVSFEISAGQHIGLTGASGSGKTTITQLLLRL